MKHKFILLILIAALILTPRQKAPPMKAGMNRAGSVLRQVAAAERLGEDGKPQTSQSGQDNVRIFPEIMQVSEIPDGDIKSLREALITLVNERQISWQDPSRRNGAPECNAMAASFPWAMPNIDEAWYVSPDAVALAADVRIFILPTKEEIRQFPDLENLKRWSNRDLGYEDVFGVICGRFYFDKNGKPVFLITIVQTGEGWRSLARRTKDRYDPPRGSSRRPEGHLYSWYGSGIAMLEECLKAIGIQKIAIISNTGIKAIRAFSVISIKDRVADKFYSKPGPGYEPTEFNFRDNDSKYEFNVHAWVKDLSVTNTAKPGKPGTVPKPNPEVSLSQV